MKVAFDKRSKLTECARGFDWATQFKSLSNTAPLHAYETGNRSTVAVARSCTNNDGAVVCYHFGSWNVHAISRRTHCRVRRLGNINSTECALAANAIEFIDARQSDCIRSTSAQLFAAAFSLPQSHCPIWFDSTSKLLWFIGSLHTVRRGERYTRSAAAKASAQQKRVHGVGNGYIRWARIIHIN